MPAFPKGWPNDGGPRFHLNPSTESIVPYRICKSFEIESGHMLSKHPEKCRFPHGHTRKVEFVLEAATLDANDMVCDFKLIKELMSEFLDGYDHALCMNTEDAQY